MSRKAMMTVEQFAQMVTADTETYELVDGELISLSSGTLGCFYLSEQRAFATDGPLQDPCSIRARYRRGSLVPF